MERIKQAIILAAGEGQRLKPFTALMPKVMLPIAGKPILEYVIEALAQNGIRRIVMVVGYKREQVQDYFASGHNFGVEIEYVIQGHQLGTAHALRQAKDVADDRFLVLAGDNIIEPDTIASLISADTPTILVKRQQDVSKYGVVLLRGDGKVRDIVEKPAEMISNLVNTGIYAFNREIFEFVEDELDLPNAIQGMLSQGYSITVLETSSAWLDAVYPWDLLSLNSIILNKLSPGLGGTIESGSTITGLVSIGKGSIIRANCYIVGPVIIGESCELGPSVCILPSTSIGNNAVISPFSLVENSIIGSDVNIGPGSSLQNSILAPGSLVKGHLMSRSGESTIFVEGEYHQVEMGAIVGSYCELGNNVLLEPGAIIGNNCRIKGMKVVSGNVLDKSLVI